MIDRRQLMKIGTLATLEQFWLPRSVPAQMADQKPIAALSKGEWLEKATEAANHPNKDNKTSGGLIVYGRFIERIFFLMKPISWSPTPGVKEQSGYPNITVPTGFVTDGASIPQLFFSLLPPDGPYTFPAVIHDYLYWNQTSTKVVADNVFNFGMQDFQVGTIKRNAIFDAVRLAGQSAWDSNAKDKARGERRVLKRFPDNSTTKWEDWKRDPRNFA